MLTVESGSAGPLAINLHRSVLGHDAVKEVVQVVGLCCPAQRVGTGRCLPEIQVASKQVKVRAGPVSGCIPSAASSDPGQDHQQAEQGMLNLAGSVGSKGGQNPADVREQASSPTWLKVAEDETASQPRACRETGLNKLRNFLEVIIYLDNKPCAGPDQTKP
jgi:hypothetical protein